MRSCPCSYSRNFNKVASDNVKKSSTLASPVVEQSLPAPARRAASGKRTNHIRRVGVATL